MLDDWEQTQEKWLRSKISGQLSFPSSGGWKGNSQLPQWLQQWPTQSHVDPISRQRNQTPQLLLYSPLDILSWSRSSLLSLYELPISRLLQRAQAEAGGAVKVRRPRTTEGKREAMALLEGWCSRSVQYRLFDERVAEVEKGRGQTWLRSIFNEWTIRRRQWRFRNEKLGVCIRWVLTIVIRWDVESSRLKGGIWRSDGNRKLGDDVSSKHNRSKPNSSRWELKRELRECGPWECSGGRPVRTREEKG